MAQKYREIFNIFQCVQSCTAHTRLTSRAIISLQDTLSGTEEGQVLVGAPSIIRQTSSA